MQKGEVQLQSPDKAPIIVFFSLNYYFIKTLYLLLRMRKISFIFFLYFFLFGFGFFLF